MEEKSFKLKIITSTVREGRQGPKVANWIAGIAAESTPMDVEVLELGEINLPMCAEPHHPKLKKYVHESTKKWSAKIDEADAFIFVVAEYNHSFPAPLKNALDTVCLEWGNKPAGLVSYAGVSAGTRATNELKIVLNTLRMTPLIDCVHIPFFSQFIDGETGAFKPSDVSDAAAMVMLKSLTIHAKHFRNLREELAQIV